MICRNCISRVQFRGIKYIHSVEPSLPPNSRSLSSFQTGTVSSKQLLFVPASRQALAATLLSSIKLSAPGTCITSIMLLQFNIKGLFEDFLPKGIIIHKRKKDRHACQKEDDLHNGVPQETTVLGCLTIRDQPEWTSGDQPEGLGTIQILFGLVIASLGAILVSTSYVSHYNAATSATLMSGYPFVGALCFVIAGSLSVISGKTATKFFEVSSLTSNAASCVAAGVSLVLLTHSLVALNTASPHGHSGKKNLTLLLSSEYHYLTDKEKNCLLADDGLRTGLGVVLVFTALELLLAAYASVFWWKQVYSNKPESTFSPSQSQDHTQHVKMVL